MKSKKAFTLIELLIVIAIIGVLSGIVLVNMGSAREKAKLSKIMTTMRSIHAAVSACKIAGGSLNNPAYNGNGGTAICTIGSEVFPNISDMGFSYCPSPACGGFDDGVDGHFAFSAYSGSYSDGVTKIVVCGSDTDKSNSWYGPYDWNFVGKSGCKKQGF